MDSDIFVKRFGFEPRYYLNDISFDKANMQQLLYHLGKIRFDDSAKYDRLKQFVLKHEKDKYAALPMKAHLAYIDGDFEASINYFLQMIERCPTNIDTWQSLSVAMMKTRHYELAWDIMFNIYHFIHFFQKYNFHTLNIENLTILKNIIKNSEPKNNYLWQPKFEGEFLIVSRKCNNNCMTCPNKHSLKNSDIMPYLNGIGMSLAEYISLKIRKKHIKTLVFTGGEPTITGNFFGIVDAIYHARPDINLVVQTNGRAFSSNAFIAWLEKYKSKKICFEVSLFSDKENIHDRITRCKGSFEQTVKGITNLLKGSYPVEINILVNEYNLKNIKNIVGFIVSTFEEYKAFNKINFIIPIPSGNYAYAYDKNEAKNMLDITEKYMKNYKRSIPLEMKNRYL